jgi:AraC family transcriptional regulator, positive regulator of tynA and feaB
MNTETSAVLAPWPRPCAVRSPVELRFRTRDDWHAGLRHYLLPLDCSVFDPHAFRCKALIVRLCGATIAELRMDASRLVRRPVDIDGAEHECVKVFWQLSGRSRFQQGPNSAVLETGNWTICDSGREYTIELERNTRCLLLLVPRPRCPQWLPALSALSARTLPAGGAAHIAMAALTAMLRDATPLDTDSETALHDSVIALIECAPPHTFISDAKFNRACALLRVSASQVSVAGVARQCGFADPAHFSRAFHARHGVAPTTWREQAA